MLRFKHSIIAAVICGIVGFFGLTAFAVYRHAVVSDLIHQLYRHHDCAIGDDDIPVLGTTSVMIGSLVPGTVPTISSDEVCGLLGQLHEFWRLEQLSLIDIAVDARCIRSALRRTHLERLSVDGTPCDDDFLLAVVEQGTVKHLGVRRTRVTIDGLRALKKLRSLESVGVDGNGFTSEELTSLQRELPLVQILSDVEGFRLE